jgi:hypothetical protein
VQTDRDHQLKNKEGESVKAWLTMGEVVAVHIDKAMIQTASISPRWQNRSCVQDADYFTVKPEDMFEMVSRTEQAQPRKDRLPVHWASAGRSSDRTPVHATPFVQPDRQASSASALAVPADTNANGDIFGGWLLSQMDVGGGSRPRSPNTAR